MSQRTEQRYEEIAAWLEGNVPRQGADWDKRWAFLMRVVENLMTLNAMLLVDLQKAEGRAPRLWLPGELQVQGDVRRLG